MSIKTSILLVMDDSRACRPNVHVFQHCFTGDFYIEGSDEEHGIKEFCVKLPREVAEAILRGHEEKP
jgi:hypothetical protein